MKERIKIIIADDNIGFCDLLKKFLEKNEDIEILGLAHTDDEEIKQIEELKPEIVITDLMRNHKYTGLHIIEEYMKRDKHPEFLIISADKKEDTISTNIKIGGYIEKPFFDYDSIIQELRRIKEEINIYKEKNDNA